MSNQEKGNIGKILHKWYEAKQELNKLEEKINKYKVQITKEMNARDTDTISANGYKVSRRRNTRTYVSKESLPPELWKQYSTRSSFDAFFLVRGN